MTDHLAAEDNRIALLTAPGVAAIAVVRLSGPAAEPFLRRRFSKPVPEGRCVHGILKFDDRVLDDAVAVRIGNTVDLNLHGGSYVVQSVIELAQNDGFSLSEVDTTDANSELWKQVLQSLPLARTEQALRMLLAQPKAWESPGDLQKILDDPSGYWMLALPRVAIVGPPNVGKSTLANQLFGQSRSITADLPGTTRDWVGEIANIDGLAVMLIDTPGIRSAADPIEAAAITASRQQIQSADLVLLVLDQSQPLDESLLAAYPSAIKIANKADTATKWNSEQIQAIQTIATTGIGLDELRKQIRICFVCEPLLPDRPRWWTKPQQQKLKAALNLNLHSFR